MAIEKLYPEDPDKDPRHKPEVIIPDDEFEEHHRAETDLQALKVRASLGLRFLMFLLAFLGALTLAFNLLVLLAHTLLVAATFFRSPVFIEVWKRTYRAVKRWSVITLGALLAVLIPSVGITFMLSYFLVSSDRQRQHLFMKIFRNHVDAPEDDPRYWS